MYLLPNPHEFIRQRFRRRERPSHLGSLEIWRQQHSNFAAARREDVNVWRIVIATIDLKLVASVFASGPREGCV
jgi:hypothetical protein